MSTERQLQILPQTCVSACAHIQNLTTKYGRHFLVHWIKRKNGVDITRVVLHIASVTVTMYNHQTFFYFISNLHLHFNNHCICILCANYYQV